ncbi:MAG TPA: hypothetical protein VGE12_08100 [Noviherbaspirillum sp.]
MVQIALRAAFVGCACLLAGCALFRQPPHAAIPAPAGVSLAGAPVASPDGKKLVWHVMAEEGMTTLVRDSESGDTAVYRLGRTFPFWTDDSRYLILEQDLANGGTRILIVDTARPKTSPANLTPWDGSRSFVLHTGNARAGRVVFISNRRHRADYDVYAGDLRSGQVELLYRNNGDVVQWIMDEDGTLGARVRRQDEDYILQVLGKQSGTWKSVYSWKQTDIVLPVRIERDIGKVILVANAGRGRRELVELKLAALAGTKH